MINPPKPNHLGQIEFNKKRGGGKLIENYPVGQTIENLNAQLVAEYCEMVERAQNAGKSTDQAKREAANEAVKLSQFKAVGAWQDTNAEIRLKKALKIMMRKLKIPALLIRSVNLKAMSALQDLG